MKNNILVIFIIFAVLGVVGAYLFNAGVEGVGGIGNSGSSPSGEIQKITLSWKNYNYYPNTITVKANQPVSITLDSSISGCYRDFVIKDLGVRKRSRNPSDTIDFTPTKKGTFTFACSMYMGYGKIVVE